MVTAFVDMVGLLMVIPLLPFVARELGGDGFAVGLLLSAFSLAQLLSAPLWGRFSDRYGRRPALMIGLGASAIAYVVFAYAGSLLVLILSRIVQGAGGGTVGVLQAYVADTLEPRERAKGLGWISAATSLGVMIGPALGTASLAVGREVSWIGDRAPGLFAAVICAVNMAFAWGYLRESRVAQPDEPDAPPPVRARQAVRRVLSNPGDAAPRLIWIYAIGMGAFFGFNAIMALFLADRFGVGKENIAWAYTWNGAVAVLARAWLLGKLVDRMGEARLSRLGLVLLLAGLAILPFTWRIHPGPPIVLLGWSVEPRILLLGATLSLMPLGTAFTFPCVTGLLSQVIDPRERGVMMGVQQSFGGVARVIFPVLAGWTYQHLGTGYPFWTSAVLVLGTLFLSLGIDARPRPRPAEAPVAAD